MIILLSEPQLLHWEKQVRIIATPSWVVWRNCKPQTKDHPHTQLKNTLSIWAIVVLVPTRSREGPHLEHKEPGASGQGHRQRLLCWKHTPKSSKLGQKYSHRNRETEKHAQANITMGWGVTLPNGSPSSLTKFSLTLAWLRAWPQGEGELERGDRKPDSERFTLNTRIQLPKRNLHT